MLSPDPKDAFLFWLYETQGLAPNPDFCHAEQVPGTTDEWRISFDLSAGQIHMLNTFKVTKAGSVSIQPLTIEGIHWSSVKAGNSETFIDIFQAIHYLSTIERGSSDVS